MLDKENHEYIYKFITEELRFCPSADTTAPFLPFALNRPFAVYDISGMNSEQAELLYELAPTAIANCMQPGYQLYWIDWFHNTVLYDPFHPEICQAEYEIMPSFNRKGIAHFDGFLPDGDYYFYIDKYGYFGYLTHPWRQEVWIFGEQLINEFRMIYKQIGFRPKAVLT